MYHNLVLSGGSLKGIAFVGCLQYLEERNVLKNVTTFVGSSAGSIVCFMACCGMTAKQMKSFFEEELKRYSSHEIDIDNILNIYTTMGFDDGRFFKDLFRAILAKRFHGKDDITFIDFAKVTGKNLVICGSNITKHSSEYFCVDRTPDMSVITALRISISLPIVFTPVVYNGNVYVDASLFNNFPTDYLAKENKMVDTLGISIENKQHVPDIENMNLLVYMKLLVDSSFYRMNEKLHGKNSRVITVRFDDLDAYNFDINELKFKIDASTISDYITTGYKQVTESFESRPLQMTAAGPAQ